ncbi:MAG: ABC transporter substrate-binding protein [bacterium]|nr:ABC transporter substrate-binding protein [bacterium]
MKRTTQITLTTLIVCLGLLALGCPRKEVRLGAVLPVTGADQLYGESIRRGIDVAYEELLADSDYTLKIELTVVDSESDSEKAQELLEQQYRDGALAVLGGATSDEAKQMINVVDRFDRVLLSPSASAPELTGVSENFYRIFPSDFTAASKMADFAIRTLKVESVVVLAEERTYAKGIQAVFKSAYEDHGGEVLEVIEVPRHTSDLGGLVEHVMTLEPDAVYLAAYATGVGAMIQELRRLNYEGRILTTSAFATPAAIAEVGHDAEGVLLTQTVFDPDSEHAHVQKFVQAYEAKYEEEPNIFAAHGYDAMKVLAAAIEGRPLLPGEVRDGLRDAIQDFPGVTGSIRFNEKGDVVKFPRVYVIGEDLGLYDYTERVRQSMEDIRRRREELRRRLDQLHQEASEMGGN